MLKGAKFYETVAQHCVTFTFCVLKVVQMLIVQKKKDIHCLFLCRQTSNSRLILSKLQQFRKLEHSAVLFQYRYIIQVKRDMT